MEDESSLVGSTIDVTVANTSGEFTVATGGGNTVFVYGDVSVGDRVPVRIFREDGGTPVGLGKDAEIQIRVDEVTADGTSKGYPNYGPVVIEMELTEGDWYRCRVVCVREDRVEAKPLNKIPRRSQIESGPLPEDPTQSLNRLVNNKHNRS